MPVDLVSVGEAFEDYVFMGLPRLPRLGEEIKTNTFVQTLGGGVIITAVAARRLGATCHVISALSPAARALLGREQIEVTDLRRPHERAAVTAALSTVRDRAFVTYNGVNDRLERRLFTAVARVQSRHVHFALYPRDCARWRRVVSRLTANGVSTSWDFGWNEPLTRDDAFPLLLAQLDIVFVNEYEATMYSGTRTLAAAARFWKRLARTTVIKCGARGSRWVTADAQFEERAPRVTVVDTTGAGDAFNGGFLAARLAGSSPVDCLRAGNRVGAMSTRRAGGIDGLPRRRTAS